MNKSAVPEAMRQILAAIQQLSNAYPHKKFTIDGRLLGDIGEVLCEDVYDLKLFGDVQRHHDATCSDDRKVQIKATMGGGKTKFLTFPAHHVPDYLLGVLIKADGTFEEIFNGPGRIAAKAIANRSVPRNFSLHCVSLSRLRELQKEVAKEDRIPFRQPAVALAA